MKHNFFSLCKAILFLLCTQIEVSFAQWETHGPYGGPINTLKTFGGNVFAGTGNGVFKSPDNGMSWSAANAGIQRKTVNALTTNNSGIFAGVYSNGIYFSADNGASWTAKNNGLTSFTFTAIFSSDPGLFAATSDGVFYSANNGSSWSLANNGIPINYSIYSFARVGSTVFGGTYGLGLYATSDNGGTWSVVAAFPPNTFVYALIADGGTVYAGTSMGIYKSVDGGINWVLSNKGFPSGMWAKSFAMKAGSIFAGTYSEGIFVSTDNGNNWKQINNGIPDLPFTTGLPHNYPSVESLITNGANVLAGTMNGMYASPSNGVLWFEANNGILATDITAQSANDNVIFSGTAATGVYVSSDNGISWSRANSGLTNYNILALTTISSWVYVSVENSKVFRSNDNGASWTLASHGLPAPAAILKSSSDRIVAITQGAKYVPPGLYQTVDGLNWTLIVQPGSAGGMSALSLGNQEMYIGTSLGSLFRRINSEISWQNITGNLPSTKITAILPLKNILFIGTDGQGIFRSDNNGNWSPINIGIKNKFITDIQMQNGILYASSWGGGVFTSNDLGASWVGIDDGLMDMYVRNLSINSVNLFAGTDAGVYQRGTNTLGIKNQTSQHTASVYPNPSSGLIYLSNPAKEKTQVTVYNSTGELIYQKRSGDEELSIVDFRDRSKGIYFIHLLTDKGTTVKKIVVE